jgi:hypothetical protein
MAWLPALIFGACGLAQFWFLQRLASALEARHPEIYRRIYGLFALNRLAWFAIARKDRALNDPDLTSRTKQFQAVIVIAMLAWLAMMVLLMSGAG